MGTNEYQREYYRKRIEETGTYFGATRASYYQRNKEKYAERSKNWYGSDENKMKLREKRHHINFQAAYDAQKGLCAIGGEPLPEKLDSIHIDHDHACCPGHQSCGKCFRGLTCRPHNVGLGMFNDDFELLERAARYIIKAKVRYLNG